MWKVILILSHGQSDVERGFSTNKEILQVLMDYTEASIDT